MTLPQNSGILSINLIIEYKGTLKLYKEIFCNIDHKDCVNSLKYKVDKINQTITLSLMNRPSYEKVCRLELTKQEYIKILGLMLDGLSEL